MAVFAHDERRFFDSPQNTCECPPEADCHLAVWQPDVGAKSMFLVVSQRASGCESSRESNVSSMLKQLLSCGSLGAHSFHGPDEGHRALLVSVPPQDTRFARVHRGPVNAGLSEIAWFSAFQSRPRGPLPCNIIVPWLIILSASVDHIGRPSLSQSLVKTGWGVSNGWCA